MDISGVVVGILTSAMSRFDNKELAFGIGAGILVVALGIEIYFHFRRHRPLIAPIRQLTSGLRQFKNPAGQSDNNPINQADRVFDAAPQQLKTLWRAYKQHLLPDTKTGNYINLVDPRLWFSVESLPGRGYEQWCATWAGIFLTVGLLFTFIGLSAALLKVGNIDGADSAAMKTAITGILGVSSAKFITSIAGLIAYIGFSLVTRRYHSSQREAVSALADAVQHLTVPLTPELLLYEQNETSRKQLARLDRFTDDLAIAIDGKLRERLADLGATFGGHIDGIKTTLPEATNQPIVNELNRIGDKIGQGNEEAIRTMLKEFLEGLQHGTGDSLEQAAKSLEDAAKQLGTAKGSIDTSGEKFGKDIEGAAAALTKAAEQMTNGVGGRSKDLEKKIGQLGDTINGIVTQLHQVPGDISKALTETLKKLTTAVEDLKDGIAQGGEVAGKNLKDAASSAGDTLQQKIDQVSDKLDLVVGTLGQIPNSIDGALNATLSKLNNAIDALVERLGQGGVDGGQALREGGQDAGERMKELVEQAGSDFDRAIARTTESLVDWLTELERSIQTFSISLDKTESVLKTLPGSVAEQVRNLNDAGQTFKAAGQTVADAGGTLREAAQPLQETATAIQSGLSQIRRGVEDGEANRQRTVKAVQTVLDALKAAADAAQHTFKLHAERFGRADEALAKALTELRSGVDVVSKQTQEIFVQYDKHISQSFGSLQAVAEELQEVAEDLGDSCKQLAESNRQSPRR